jgi:hypothetical protein
VYDPGSANGRLLLGLKGTISELELHTIRSRLTAGLLAKAERGELALTLPIGFIRDPSGGTFHAATGMAICVGREPRSAVTGASASLMQVIDPMTRGKGRLS